ncbi:MAG TPA: WS/DGAT domain-containing protein, partial [Moraxellaceae bacterium]|nr:WS/DGAT domain-containing protein [Moraxellaceae bacterium]
LSYCDTLTISITSSPEVLQDPERLAGYMTEALDELEQAVNQTAASSELITANSLSGIQVGA